MLPCRQLEQFASWILSIPTEEFMSQYQRSWYFMSGGFRKSACSHWLLSSHIWNETVSRQNIVDKGWSVATCECRSAIFTILWLKAWICCNFVHNKHRVINHLMTSPPPRETERLGKLPCNITICLPTVFPYCFLGLASKIFPLTFEEDFLVVPLDITDFTSHSDCAATVIQHFGKV